MAMNMSSGQNSLRVLVSAGKSAEEGNICSLDELVVIAVAIHNDKINGDVQ